LSEFPSGIWFFGLEFTAYKGEMMKEGHHLRYGSLHLTHNTNCRFPFSFDI